MELGAAGETLIKSFESLRLVVYPDEDGIPTGGWGHTGWYSPGVPMRIGDTCTQDQAQAWFQSDVAWAVTGVIRCLDVAPNPNQFDALVSFTFNDGVSALAHSTLLSYVNQEMYDRAALEFLKWDYTGGKQSAGLERRRRAEEALFLTPSTAGAAP